MYDVSMGWIALHVTVTGTVAPGCTGTDRSDALATVMPTSSTTPPKAVADGYCTGVWLKPSVTRHEFYRDVEGLAEVAGLVRAFVFLEAKANVPGTGRDIGWCSPIELSVDRRCGGPLAKGNGTANWAEGGLSCRIEPLDAERIVLALRLLHKPPGVG